MYAIIHGIHPDAHTYTLTPFSHNEIPLTVEFNGKGAEERAIEYQHVLNGRAKIVMNPVEYDHEKEEDWDNGE